MVTVRVRPTRAWPEIAGRTVLLGGAMTYDVVYVTGVVGAVTLCV